MKRFPVIARSFRVLVVTTLMFGPASAGTGGARSAPQGSESPTFHISRGERVEMQLDTSRIAVQYHPNASDLERSQAVDHAALQLDESRPTGVKNWFLLKLASPLSVAGEVHGRLKTLLESPAVEFASPVFHGPDGHWTAVTPDILLRFRPEYVAAAETLLAAFAPDLTVISRSFGNLPGAFKLRSDQRDGFAVLARANVLALDSRIAWAEPDVQFSGSGSLVPNDPDFGEMWHIVNSGQFGGVPGMDMDVDLAWDITTGSAAVKVLVLDTGVQPDHPDINYAAGSDFTTDAGDGGPVNQCDRHGTAVAGIISGVMNNNLGATGIAPDSPVLSARPFITNITTPCGGGWTSEVSWTVEALAWGETQGARVSNNSNSYGSSLQSQAIIDAYAMTRTNGMVHFGSAGNSAIDDLSWPAELSEVNAVSALEVTGERATFSNWNVNVSLAGPGREVYTTDRTGADGYTPFDYTYFSGTSAASPGHGGRCGARTFRQPVVHHSRGRGANVRFCPRPGRPWPRRVLRPWLRQRLQGGFFR